MKPQYSNKYVGFFVLALLYITAGCGNMQSVYSEQAYQQAVSLKVESLNLMETATESFSTRQAAVETLQTDLQKAFQYAQGRPNNETTTRQWQLLMDPERNLLGGFLALWEENGSLTKVFIEENKKIISDAFDTIIELESGKRKPSDLE